MLVFTIRSLWVRRWYTIAILLVLIVIGAGWSVLSSTSQTAQYVVDEDLDLYWHTTYDLLVRPPGSVSPQESQYGMVEANFLSNVYGGITREQYEEVGKIPGVEVAAPIAPVGFMIGDPPSLVAQFPQLPPKWLEEGKPIPDTLYGAYRWHVEAFVDNGLETYRVFDQMKYLVNLPPPQPFLPPSPDPEVQYLSGPEFYPPLGFHVRCPVVGIDPEQETSFLGLDEAVVEGRYLVQNDGPRKEPLRVTWLLPDGRVEYRTVPLPNGSSEITVIPVLLNASPYLNAYGRLQLERYDLPADFDLLSMDASELKNYLQEIASTLLVSTTTSPQTAVQAFFTADPSDDISLSQGALRYKVAETTCLVRGYRYLVPSLIRYQERNKVPETLNAFPLILEPIPVGRTEYGKVTFREAAMVSPDTLKEMIRWEQVGTYDPYRLGLEPGGLVDVPLETYYPPYAILRYDPDGNPVTPTLIRPTLDAPHSYLLPPPYALVTLDTAEFLTGRKDFISAIRVRVVAAERRNERSQALVEAVAAEIEHRTGLHADITLGSSLNRTLVYIPGYEDIPPVGYVEEGWVVKGTNLAIAHKVNWAHLTLSVAALVTCLSAIAILMASSVVARACQWGLFRALGWRPRAIQEAILLEAGLLGSVGGLLAMSFAWLVGTLLRLSLTRIRLLSVPPVTLLLCLLASSYALQRVSAIRPIAAIREEAATPSRRRLRVFSLWVLSLRGLVERRGLAGLGFLGLTTAMTLWVMLLGVGDGLEHFLGTTRLGEHILGLAGWYYYILLIACLVIAGVSIADSIRTEVHRRRAEIGVYLAVGWKRVHVIRVFVGQAALLGMAGGLSGSALGIALLNILTGELPSGWQGVLGAGIALAFTLSIGSALYPAQKAAQLSPAEAMRNK